MKRSRWELSINVVFHEGIFKNNQITLFPSLTFMSKTGVSFNWTTALELLSFGHRSRVKKSDLVWQVEKN